MHRMVLFLVGLVAFVGLIVVVALAGCGGSDERAITTPAGGVWVMTDLGLGHYRLPYAINDKGQIVGETFSSLTSGHLSQRPEHRAFLLEGDEMRDLGTLGDPSDDSLESVALAINERGQIVGWAEREEDEFHAFLWADGEMHDLGVIGGGWQSSASAINERGQIVGESMTGAAYGEGGGSTTLIEHAVLWEKGKIRDLGTLGGPSSGASDVNELGQIVGSSHPDWCSSRSLGPCPRAYHGFLWEEGRMRDLGYFNFYPEGINDRGLIVGAAFKRKGVAVLWRKGKLFDLGTLGGPMSEALGINNQGQIVGASDTEVKGSDGFPISHAFLWEKGAMTDLGTLEGDKRLESRAVAINDSGQIVGWSETKNGEIHAVLWTLKH